MQILLVNLKVKMIMTMTTINKWCLTVFLCFLPLLVSAQKKDFGIWYGVSAEHKISNKLVINLSTDVRTFKKASRVDEAFLEGGLDYNFIKYLSLDCSYRLIKKIEDNNSYYFQHKVFMDIKANAPLGNFSFTTRLRFQIRTKTYIQDDNDNYPDYTGQIKFKVLYKTQSFPLNPYIYVESFRPMFSGKSGTVDKNKFSAGMELRITKRHSIEAEYIFQRDFQPQLSDINIISVNYNIKF
jgi:hypothetical protein